VRKLLTALAWPVGAALAGLVVAALLAGLAGEDPIRVLGILARSAFGSSFGFGYTLYYATPLIFAGLAVALPYRAGLFNIGAEGQLLVGSAAVAAVGIGFASLPGVAAIPLGIAAGAVAGAAWGLLAGWMRARRGAHEVIVTILLNIVAGALVNWIILALLKDPSSQAAESLPIGDGFRIESRLVEGTPANWTFLLGIALAVLAHYLLVRTVFGFDIRATGQNPSAARAQGISEARVLMIVMALAGALAGLVGVNEVMGQAWRLKDGFSPGYGYTGIAVALLARGRPLGVIPAALFFGALHRGAADLDIDTENVSRDLALVMQAIVILVVAVEAGRLRRTRSPA
jgi:simple sugar transport system permease protein